MAQTADAVTQAGSEVQVRHIPLTEFEQLFEMKGQFGQGSFGCVTVAVSVLEWKMVTIKMLWES